MLKFSPKILPFIFIVGAVNLYSKDLPKTYDAPVQLSKSDKKKVEHANELVKEGIDLWDQLNNQYNPDNITNYKIDSAYNKDAYPILLRAAQKFIEGNSLKYDVYHDNCTEFFKKHRYDSPSGLEGGKKYQKEATNYIEKAQSNRRAADNYKNEYAKAYSRFFEAISLEIIAVKKEGRALQIYQDWPVHYAYQFDDDIEVDLFNPKVAVVVKKDPPKTDPPKVEVKNEPYVEPYDSTVIYYQVQIAAHTQPLAMDYLKNIYIGAIKINEIHEDEWYKYTLGRYKTFEEAAKLLRSINVPKAFVVAYKNGKRVKLKEVIEPAQKSLNAPGQEKEKPKSKGNQKK